MKTFTKSALRKVLALLALSLVLLALARSMFIVDRMGGSSMSPLIAPNDIVIATRWFRSGSLRSGDLVIVDVPDPSCHSTFPYVRRVRQKTPTDQFRFETANTNCYESIVMRDVGALPAEEIRGRVIWIVRGR